MINQLKLTKTTFLIFFSFILSAEADIVKLQIVCYDFHFTEEKNLNVHLQLDVPSLTETHIMRPLGLLPDLQPGEEIQPAKDYWVIKFYQILKFYKRYKNIFQNIFALSVYTFTERRKLIIEIFLLILLNFLYVNVSRLSSKLFQSSDEVEGRITL